MLARYSYFNFAYTPKAVGETWPFVALRSPPLSRIIRRPTSNIKQHALSDLRFIPSSSSSNRRYRNGMVEPGRAADGAVVDRVGEIADVLDSGAVGPGVGYSSFFAPARGRSVSSWTGRWTTRSAGMGAIRFVAFACGTSRRVDADEPRTCRADEPSSRCRAGRRRRAERRGGAEAGPLGEEDGGDAGAPAAPGGEERTAALDEPAAAPDEPFTISRPFTSSFRLPRPGSASS